MTAKAKKGKLYLLGEGYPWYASAEIDGKKDHGLYNEISLWKDHNGFRAVFEKGRETLREWRRKPMKIRWGAYQKVRIWIEKVPERIK